MFVVLTLEFVELYALQTLDRGLTVRAAVSGSRQQKLFALRNFKSFFHLGTEFFRNAFIFVEVVLLLAAEVADAAGVVFSASLALVCKAVAV